MSELSELSGECYECGEYNDDCVCQDVPIDDIPVIIKIPCEDCGVLITTEVLDTDSTLTKCSRCYAARLGWAAETEEIPF